MPQAGIEIVADAKTGQPVERARISIANDNEADIIKILGSANADTLIVSDYSVGGLTGIGVVFNGAGLAGNLQIVVSRSIRAEGDTLIIETLGGADIVNASTLATDRAALKLIGGDR